MAIIEITSMPPGEEPNQCREDLVGLKFTCDNSGLFFHISVSDLLEALEKKSIETYNHYKRKFGTDIKEFKVKKHVCTIIR